MIRQLGGFLQRVCKHGHKFAPDHNGKFTIVTGSWGTKYILNKDLFFKLWHDDDMKCYFDLATLGDKKLAKLIARHFKKDSKEQPSENTISTTLLQEEKKMDYPVYAANIPDEDDDIQETTQPQPTEQPKATQPTTIQKAHTNIKSKLLPRLQEFVDRRLISSGEARLFAKVYGVTATYKAPKNEFAQGDIADMTREQLKTRGIILNTFLKETSGRDDLDDSSKKTIRATQDKLGDIAKKLEAQA